MRRLSRALSGRDGPNGANGGAHQAREVDELQKQVFGEGEIDWKPSKLSEVVLRRDSGEVVLERHDPEKVLVMMRGRLQAGFEFEEEPKEVRFFLSSTFSDFKIERDLFMAFAAPRLRDMCRKVGLEFYYSDMRWGVIDVLTDSHRTAEICLKELDRCLEGKNVGVNFVGLLGDKYGYEPFPAELEVELFDMLMKYMNTKETELLEKWFQLDNNKTPAVYALRNISGLIPGYNPNKADENSRLWWEDNFIPMQKALRRSAEFLAEEKEDRTIATPFLQSLTETEMRTGFSKSKQTLLISRQFKNIVKSSGGEPAVWVDHQDRSDKIAGIRKEMSTLATQTFSHRGINFDANGLNPSNPEHAAYLREVIQNWVKFVEDSVADNFRRFMHNEQVGEVRSNLLFARKKAEGFVGRVELIDEVWKAVIQKPDNQEGGKIIALYGPSGSGKTSVIAKVAIENILKAASGAEGKATRFALWRSSVSVIRFLGTTILSRNIHSVIRSICMQLATAYEMPTVDLPNDFNRLLREFHDVYLKLARKRHPIIIVLDSIDQMSDGWDLTWLPRQVPKYVTILVSAIPFPSIVGSMERIPHERIDVGLLEDRDEAGNVLDFWLEHLSGEPRKLSPTQRQAILSTFQQSASPSFLLLRILFNETLSWRSSTPVPQTWAEISDVPNAIEKLFDRIEKEHGAVFVRTTFGLLTAAKDGLTTPELEDLLSASNEVLEDTFQWWIPPLARIPPLLVTRLLDSVEDFMVTNSHRWFHRQFREAAERRYLGDASASRIYDLLASYFSDGSMKILPKKIEKHGVWLSQERQIQSQPTILGNGRPNVRKIRELPFALLEAKRTTECFDVIAVPSFLQAVMEIGLINEILDLLRNDSLPEFQIRRLLASAISHRKGMLLSFPAVTSEEVYSSLAPSNRGKDKSKKLGFILSQFDKARRHGVHSCWGFLREPADSPLVFTIDGTAASSVDGGPGSKLGSAVTSILVSDSPDPLIAVSSGADINLYSSIGVLITTLRGHSLLVSGLCPLVGGNKLVSASWDKTVRVWDLLDLSSTASDFVLSGHSGRVAAVTSFAGVENKATVASASWDATVRIWDATTGALSATLAGSGALYHLKAIHGCIVAASQMKVFVWDSRKSFDLQMSEDLLPVGSDAKVSGFCAFVPSKQKDVYIAFGVEESVFVRPLLKNKNKKRSIEMQGTLKKTVRSIAVAEGPEGSTLVVAGFKEGKMKIFDMAGKKLNTLQAHASHVSIIAGSLEGFPSTFLLTGCSNDSGVRFWDLNRAFGDGVGLSDDAHEFPVTELASAVLKNKDRVIVSAGRQVKVWKESDGSLISTMDGMGEYNRAERAYVTAMCVLQLDDGRAVVATGGSPFFGTTIKLWDAEKGALIKNLDDKKHVKTVKSLCSLEPGPRYRGPLLASGSNDNSIKIWDVYIGAHLCTLSKHLAGVEVLCFVPKLKVGKDENIFVSGSLDPYIRTWTCSGADAKELKEARAHPSSVRAIKPLERKGKIQIASAGGDEIRIWDPITLECIQTLTISEALGRNIKRVSEFATLRSGSIVAAARGSEIQLWDIDSGKPLSTLAQENTAKIDKLMVVMDSQGTELLVSLVKSKGKENLITLWALSSKGTLINRFDCPIGNTEVRSLLTSSPNLFVGTTNGLVSSFSTPSAV